MLAWLWLDFSSIFWFNVNSLCRQAFIHKEQLNKTYCQVNMAKQSDRTNKMERERKRDKETEEATHKRFSMYTKSISGCWTSTYMVTKNLRLRQENCPIVCEMRAYGGKIRVQFPSFVSLLNIVRSILCYRAQYSSLFMTGECDSNNATTINICFFFCFLRFHFFLSFGRKKLML